MGIRIRMRRSKDWAFGFFIKIILFFLLIAFPVPTIAAEKVRIVTTFTILADFVHQVGGENVDVATLAGPDSDPHDFDPKPHHQVELAAADIVVANGLGLEPWLDRVLSSAGFHGTLIIASAGITPIERPAEAAFAGKVDPHAFQDPSLAAIYIANIREGLIKIDPENRPYYEERAKRYSEELHKADEDIRAMFAALPTPEQGRSRAILTSHDAFAYFGRAFDLSFLPIVWGGENKDISAADLAHLIEVAKEKHVQAIFIENMTDPRLAQVIGQETGIAIGGKLYADALSSENGPVPTYIDLLRWNARVLAEAFHEASAP